MEDEIHIPPLIIPGGSNAPTPSTRAGSRATTSTNASGSKPTSLGGLMRFGRFDNTPSSVCTTSEAVSNGLLSAEGDSVSSPLYRPIAALDEILPVTPSRLEQLGMRTTAALFSAAGTPKHALAEAWSQRRRASNSDRRASREGNSTSASSGEDEAAAQSGSAAAAAAPRPSTHWRPIGGTTAAAAASSSTTSAPAGNLSLTEDPSRRSSRIAWASNSLPTAGRSPPASDATASATAGSPPHGAASPGSDDASTLRRTAGSVLGAAASSAQFTPLPAPFTLPPTPHGAAPLCDPAGAVIIGRGACANVSLYERDADATLFAVKTIRNDELGSRSGKRELGFAHRYLHTYPRFPPPGILRIHGAFRHATIVRVVTEYMDAGHAGRLAPLAEPALAALARQLCAGLRVLHEELRVVHRDIKPENVLLASGGAAKLADFGVAALLEAGEDSVTDQQGSIMQMAPERLRGEAHGFASDVWALGVTVAQLATGRHPFAPEGSVSSEEEFWGLCATLDALPGGNQEPTVSGEHAPRVLANLEALPVTPFMRGFIAECLRSDPRGRPTAAELLQHPALDLGHDDYYGEDLLAQHILQSYVTTPAPGSSWLWPENSARSHVTADAAGHA